MRRESLAVAFAVVQDLVAGVGEPVEGAVSEDRGVEQAEPLLDVAVGGDHEAGAAVTGDNQFVEVDRLLMVEPVQAEVVKEQEVRPVEAAEGLVDRAVDARLVLIGLDLDQLIGLRVGHVGVVLVSPDCGC